MISFHSLIKSVTINDKDYASLCTCYQPEKWYNPPSFLFLLCVLFLEGHSQLHRQAIKHPLALLLVRRQRTAAADPGPFKGPLVAKVALALLLAERVVPLLVG